jgi:hypothetical protein
MAMLHGRAQGPSVSYSPSQLTFHLTDT